MRQKIDVFFWLKNETKRFSLIIKALKIDTQELDLIFFNKVIKLIGILFIRFSIK